MSVSRSRQIRVEGAVLAGLLALGAALMFGTVIGGFEDSPIRSSGVALTPDVHWLAIGVLMGAVVGAVLGAAHVAPGLVEGRLRPVGNPDDGDRLCDDCAAVAPGRSGGHRGNHRLLAVRAHPGRFLRDSGPAHLLRLFARVGGPLPGRDIAI